MAVSKKMLKQALSEPLSQKDIGKISITELCQKAEINRAASYRHCNLPQDVLVDIEMEFIEKAQNVTSLPATVKGVLPYLEKLLTYVYSNAEIARVLILYSTEIAQKLIAFIYLMFVTLPLRVRKFQQKMIFTLTRPTSNFFRRFLAAVTITWFKERLINDVPNTPK